MDAMFHFKSSTVCGLINLEVLSGNFLNAPQVVKVTYSIILVLFNGITRSVTCCMLENMPFKFICSSRLISFPSVTLFLSSFREKRSVVLVHITV